MKHFSKVLEGQEKWQIYEFHHVPILSAKTLFHPPNKTHEHLDLKFCRLNHFSFFSEVWYSDVNLARILQDLARLKNHLARSCKINIVLQDLARLTSGLDQGSYTINNITKLKLLSLVSVGALFKAIDDSNRGKIGDQSSLPPSSFIF